MADECTKAIRNKKMTAIIGRNTKPIRRPQMTPMETTLEKCSFAVFICQWIPLQTPRQKPA